ncbi:MAG: IPT/TIG domain-containing protein, partial [Bryobacteraceae bacterium]
GDAGDGGPAAAGELSSPRDVAVDPLGTVYFSDQDNQRVRKLSLAAIAITAVVNAASGQPGAVAPGERVTIYGQGLGPAAGVAAPAPVAGFVGDVAGGTTVLFDGIAAPVTYASGGQANAIVPYGVATRSFTSIQIKVQGISSGIYDVAVAVAAPGLFSTGISGAGQGAILNQDGSLNSAANPAARGSVISLFGTGEGQTNPQGVTGSVPAGVLPVPALDVKVSVAGEPAEILYAGAAPGIAGVFQVNARIPDDIVPSASAPVALAVGSYGAQPGVTVAVN